MAIMIPQPFDSDILRTPVYRLDLSDPGELKSLAALVPDDAGLVSMRLPDDWPIPDPGTGFRHIESLVELQRDFAPEDAVPASRNIRLAAPADADACADIARNAFQADRYHADPMVAEELAGKLKAAWARNEVTGRTDRTFIWEEDGAVAGFNGCLLRGDSMIVDLIAVSTGLQGRGIGAALLKASFSHFAGQAKTGLIATQDSNHGALALYRKLGYAEVRRFKTFHFVPRPIGF